MMLSLLDELLKFIIYNEIIIAVYAIINDWYLYLYLDNFLIYDLYLIRRNN